VEAAPIACDRGSLTRNHAWLRAVAAPIACDRDRRKPDCCPQRQPARNLRDISQCLRPRIHAMSIEQREEINRKKT